MADQAELDRVMSGLNAPAAPGAAPAARADVDAVVGAMMAAPGETGSVVPLQEMLLGTPIDPGGMENLGARADMANAGNAEERELAFRRHFPLGELRSIPVEGSEELFFREGPDGNFRRVDPGLFDDGGFSFGEAGRDVAEFFSPDTGALTGSVGGGTLGFMIGGPPGAVVGGVLGTIAGDQAQEGVQELRGLNTEDYPTIAKRSAVKGALDLAGSGVAAAAGKGINALTRRGGLLSATPEAKAVMTAQKQIDLPYLPAYMMTDNPLIKRLGRQASMVSGIVRRRIDNIQRNLAGNVEQAAAESRRLSGDLNAAFRRAAKSLKDLQLRSGSVGREAAGQSLVMGRKAHLAHLKEVVDYAYAHARTLGPAAYDLDASLRRGTSLRDVVKKMRAGIAGVTLPDAAGNRQTIMLLQPEGPLDRALARLENLDASVLPDGVSGASDPTEQLRAVRSYLYDLTQTTDGTVPRELQRQATEVRSAIDEVLSNPVAGNKDVAAAYQTASTLAKHRLDLAESEAFVDIALEANASPSRLVDHFMSGRGGTPENIRLIRHNMPPDYFRNFVSGVKTRILAESPDDMLRRLDGVERDTLAEILSPVEMRQLRRTAERLSALGNRRLVEASRIDRETGKVLGALVEGGERSALRDIAATIRKSGVDSGEMHAARAGIIEWMADTVEEINGVRQFNVSKYNTKLGRLEQSPAWGLLTEGQRKLLRNTDAVARFMRGANDPGSSLQAAETASGILDVESSHMWDVLKYMAVGRFLSSQWGERVLLGAPTATGLRLNNFSRALGAAALQLSQDQEDTNRIGDIVSDAVSATIGRVP